MGDTAAPAPEALPATATPGIPTPEGSTPTAGARPGLEAWAAEAGCPLAGLVQRGERAWLACGAAGLWELALPPGQGRPPRVVARRDMDGEVSGVFVHGDQVWAQVAMLMARPVAQVTGGARATAVPGDQAPPQAPADSSTADTGSAAAADSTAVTEPPERWGRVIGTREGRPGDVVISLGRGSVSAGDTVELLRDRRERVGGRTLTQRDRLAVGRVSQVMPNHAVVALGLNEHVAAGDLAHAVPARPTASKVAPPRAAGFWEVMVHARPFLVVDELGAGMLTDASVGYRGESPVRVQALLSPAAFSVVKNEADVTSGLALLMASFDSQLFEVGLGIGGETANMPPHDIEVGTALSVGQLLRLGAKDGLHLRVLTNVMLFHSQFEFGSARVSGQIPLAHGTWLLLSAGGGDTGYAMGEVGLRMLLRGNGGPGSFFLRASVGGVSLFKQESLCLDTSEGFCRRTGENQDHTGPMVGLGGEWRL